MNNSKPRTFNDLLKEHQVTNSDEFEIIEELDLDLIYPNPDQPRKTFDQDKIENLAISIQQNGLFQPIVVKKVKNKYMIIAGERRFKAFQHINRKKIPAIIRQYQSKKVPEIALIENIQRENLNPIEEAKAYQYILESWKYKHHELALKIGKSRTHVVNMLGLLKLPEEILELVETGKLSMGHARAISKLSSKKSMIHVSNKCLKNHFSVRQVENYIKDQLNHTSNNKVETASSEKELELEKIYKIRAKITDNSISIKGEKEEINSIISKLLK